MKYTLSFSLFILSLSVVTETSAQVSDTNSVINKPILKFDPETGLQSSALQPVLKPLSQSQKDTGIVSKLFSGELPVVKGTRKVTSTPVVSSNMPVLKPKNNSKILIAKVDLDFPFHYNMPIKKIEGN